MSIASYFFSSKSIKIQHLANEIRAVIPLGAPTKYKRASDFVNEATGNYPVLPGFGGAARGFVQDLLSFRWNYLAVRDLLSSAGMEVRVSLESHQVFGGEFSTASFYCLVENE